MKSKTEQIGHRFLQFCCHLRLTLSKFVVDVGESFTLIDGGGGESTSSSGETEHERDAKCDCDELRERDFVQESLQLAVSSDAGETFT